MDIAILRDFRFTNALSIGYRLFKGSLHQSDHLEIIRAKQVIVKQRQSIAHIDGEPLECGQELRIEVDPLSLKVVI